jgi:hypothetical protein
VEGRWVRWGVRDHLRHHDDDGSATAFRKRRRCRHSRARVLFPRSLSLALLFSARFALARGKAGHKALLN